MDFVQSYFEAFSRHSRASSTETKAVATPPPLRRAGEGGEHVAVVDPSLPSRVDRFRTFSSHHKSQPFLVPRGSSSSSSPPPPLPPATTPIVKNVISSSPSCTPSTNEPYQPPRSSPIAIPFASKQAVPLELDLYASDPLPTHILPPLISPFKSYLNKIREPLHQLGDSLSRKSRSRVERSLLKLEDCNPTVASAVRDVLWKLESGEGGGFMQEYISWVDRQVVEARDELEVLSKRKIGWDAFAEAQILIEFERVIEEFGMYDHDHKTALLARVGLWDQEVVDALLKIIISEELGHDERVLEIKCVRWRYMSGRTRYPTTAQPPILTISELSLLLVPLPPTSNLITLESTPSAPLAVVVLDASELDQQPPSPYPSLATSSLDVSTKTVAPPPPSPTPLIPIQNGCLQPAVASISPSVVEVNNVVKNVDIPVARQHSQDLQRTTDAQPPSSASTQSTATSEVSFLESYLSRPTLLVADGQLPSSSSDSPRFSNIRRWQKMEETDTDPFCVEEATKESVEGVRVETDGGELRRVERR